jgi:WD40 repeat protein
VVVGLAGYSFQQRATAATARDDADSREVALMAGQLRGADVPLAAQLSVAAYGIARTPEAVASVLESSGTPSAAQLSDSPNVVQAVSLNPSRTLLAVAAADGTLRLWDVASPSHPVGVGGPLTNDRDDPLYTTAISPDGKILAAAGADHTVSLWNIADPDRPVPLGKPLTGPSSTVYSVTFSPDGLIVAAGSADDTVRLWNLADPLAPKALATLRGPAGYVESVAFSPSGRVLAAGSADKTVRLWNIADPSRPAALGRPLTGPANIVTSVAFSPSGQTLAAGSQDDKVWLWNVAAPAKAAPEGTLTGLVAAGYGNGTFQLWPTTGKAPAPLGPEVTASDPGMIESVSFSPDGKVLATGGDDGTVRLWSVPPPGAARAHVVRLLATEHDSDGYVFSVAFSPDGQTLAAASADGLTRLWSVRDPGQPVPLGRPLTGPASYVYSVASARTGKPWPRGSPTGRSGCGISPYPRTRPRWPPSPGRTATCTRLRSLIPAKWWPLAAPMAPSGYGIPARRRPRRRCARTKASRSAGRRGRPACPG